MSAPLAGIRVLDLSAVVVGPYATRWLSEYGAEVVKVETLDGDTLRWIAGRSPSPGMGGKFIHLNEDKRSIALDLKDPRGREVVMKLARRADVVTINMRAEAAARLGLAYADLSAINPRLVYCTMTGFGSGGRYHGRPAYDTIIQGSGGIAGIHEKYTGAPLYVPMVIADRTCGLVASHAIVVALFQRERTGRGQSIEIPMLENVAAMVLAEHLYGATFDPPLSPLGDLRLIDPNAKPIKTADGYVCVTTNTDEQAFRLMAAIGRPEMRDDPRFATKAARAENSRLYFGIRAEEMSKRTSAEWLAILEEADIPVMRYNSLDDLPNDPHLKDVGLLKRIDHPTEGGQWSITNPNKLSDYDPPPRAPAPRIGEHGVAILGELGYSEAEIAALVAAKVTVDGRPSGADQK